MTLGRFLCSRTLRFRLEINPIQNSNKKDSFLYPIISTGGFFDVCSQNEGKEGRIQNEENPLDMVARSKSSLG